MAVSFWWRDMRLSEIKPFPYPPPHKSSYQSNEASPRPAYRFPYPITLAPVPYVKPDSLHTILSDLIPRARCGQTFHLRIPVLSEFRSSNGEEMQIDFMSSQDVGLGPWPGIQIKDTDVAIRSDGLLLYVGEASYESGETPLSVWIPCRPVDQRGQDNLETMLSPTSREESPLDMFERCVVDLCNRRIISDDSLWTGSLEGEL